MSRNAVTYARKSTKDPKNPDKSVDDQAAEARAEVARRGWTLIEELSDSGISASRFANGKARPDYERLFELVETGKADAIVCFELSRLARQQSTLWLLIEMCQRKGVVVVVDGRETDMLNPGDLLLSGVKGSMDAVSSEETSLRVKRGLASSAAAGRMVPRTPYGYRRVYDPATRAELRVDVCPEEAEIVREAAGRLLGGESLQSVRGDLMRRGVVSPGGSAEWRATTLKRMVLNPVYTAKRVHRGQVIGDGDWPRVLSDEDHDALRVMLTDPARETPNKPRPGAVVHLLSGLAVCGCCGAKLRPTRRKQKYRYYICPRQGCQRIAINEDLADGACTELLLEFLAGNADALAASDSTAYRDARAAVKVLEAQQEEIGAELAAGRLSLKVASLADAGLVARIKEAEAEARRNVRSPVLEAFAVSGVRRLGCCAAPGW